MQLKRHCGLSSRSKHQRQVVRLRAAAGPRRLPLPQLCMRRAVGRRRRQRCRRRSRRGGSARPSSTSPWATRRRCACTAASDSWTVRWCAHHPAPLLSLPHSTFSIRPPRVATSRRHHVQHSATRGAAVHPGRPGRIRMLLARKAQDLLSSVCPLEARRRGTHLTLLARLCDLLHGPTTWLSGL